MKIFYTWLRFWSKFPKVWQTLVRLLTMSSELQVWQTHRGGDTAWHAYDPMTGRSACFGSEAEMRMWIEMQYYSR